MKFNEFKDETGIIERNDLKKLNNLSIKGNEILEKLKQEHDYESIKKMIENYIEKVNTNKKIINESIKKTIRTIPDLSVKINETIINTQELKNTLDRIEIINESLNEEIKKINKHLKNKGIKTEIKKKITYQDAKTKIMKNKIILDIKDLTIPSLINALIKDKEKEIEETILEKNKLKAPIINEFIKKASIDSLKKAVSEDPKHSEFLMQAYVLLKNQTENIKKLSRIINTESIKNNETELNNTITILQDELRKTSNALIKSASIIRTARLKGVKTQEILSINHENKIINQAQTLIKEYLKSNYKIDDLTKQLAYDYIITNYELIPELGDYVNYNKRSKYYFFMRFF